MRQMENRYYYLDDNKLPIECDSVSWDKRILGQRRIMTTKLPKFRKLATSFTGIERIGHEKGLFKTTLYSNLNQTMFVQYYGTYEEAIKGHNALLEEKPWDTPK